MIRRHHLLRLYLLLLIITSCSTDEPEDTSKYPSLLVGDWEYYTQEYQNYGNFSELPYLITGCAADRYYRFNSDNIQERYDYESITSRSEDEVIEDGKVIRSSTCTGDLMMRGTREWEIHNNGKTIHFTNPDGTVSTSVIEKLDEDELILQWNQNAYSFESWKTRTVFKRKK